MDTFQIITADSTCRARTGLLRTARGSIKTPVFMPVGTRGVVKGITPRQLKETGTEIVLANTYHLLVRPGIDVIEALGGLHHLMSWPGPILTDSGGYQVFSLASLSKISDDGVEFVSHIDGRRIYLGPKIATQIQNRLGADIIMCFDQCVPYPCEQSHLEEAVHRTIRWAERCRSEHNNQDRLLFGIVQGGIDLSLRTYCAEQLVKLNFNGYAIGGLSVGEGHSNMIKTVRHTAMLLPEQKPRYLMGVGTPADIIAAVREGIDMFDCVLPTRNGRNAFAFTENGPLRLRNNIHIKDSNPIEQDCSCYCCGNFSRAAIRHFFNAGEMLGPILVSLHNLSFYQRLMSRIRDSLNKNQFGEWSEEQLKRYRGMKY